MNPIEKVKNYLAKRQQNREEPPAPAGPSSHERAEVQRIVNEMIEMGWTLKPIYTRRLPPLEWHHSHIEPDGRPPLEWDAERAEWVHDPTLQPGRISMEGSPWARHPVSLCHPHRMQFSYGFRDPEKARGQINFCDGDTPEEGYPPATPEKEESIAVPNWPVRQPVEVE